MKTNTVSTFNEMVTNGLQDTTNVGVISKPASPEPNESEVDPKTDINSLPYPESGIYKIYFSIIHYLNT